MNFKKKISSIIISASLILSSVNMSFADSSKVITLGADLTDAQKQQMLNYFGVNENEAVILEVNNAEERKYLEGVATEAQLGKKTFSCAYVEPLSSGNGINVKTANLTWVTSSMIATTLSTAGLEDANVVVASLFPVSGTGGLTGVMKAFEDATGEELDEEKKEIASSELIITGDLAEDIGQDKATGVINDIKTEIIKNNTSDSLQIAETINNITNNYNVTLTSEQQSQIQDLMLKIADQDYDYNKIKDTLKNVSSIIDKNLEQLGEKVNTTGFFEKIKNWFTNLFTSDKDLGILATTNDSVLGDDAVVDATDDNAIKLPDKEEVQGLFSKIINWFVGLFKSNTTNTTTEENVVNEEVIDNNENTENEEFIIEVEENSYFDTDDTSSEEEDFSSDDNEVDDETLNTSSSEENN
jgi:uncharacterized protein YpuA (DUF1002 family)